jgi:CheY-like chemotaxis protein
MLTLAIDGDFLGLEALSVLKSSPNAVDLVLTDVMMPFLDGFGLLKELRYITTASAHHRCVHSWSWP